MQVVFEVDGRFWVGNSRLSDQYPDAMKVPAKCLTRTYDNLRRKFPYEKIEAIENYARANENVAMTTTRIGADRAVFATPT